MLLLPPAQLHSDHLNYQVKLSLFLGFRVDGTSLGKLGKVRLRVKSTINIETNGMIWDIYFWLPLDFSAAER